MTDELEFLKRLAEHPDDGALRLVFADWLTERGDPRGEVIALSAHPDATQAERRRAQRLTAKQGWTWLGPLTELADHSRCRWVGGFLSELTLKPGLAPERWARTVGEPRLATVTGLVIGLGREPPAATAWLRHRVLRRLTRLVAGADVIGAQLTPGMPFTLQRLGVISWGLFDEPLAMLGEHPLVRTLEAVELHTFEYLNARVAAEVARQVLTHRGRVSAVPEVMLTAPFGVLEGTAAWLIAGAQAERPAWRGDTWALVAHEMRFALQRDGAGHLNRLTIDTAPGDDSRGLGARIATAAAVLVQLAPAQLHEVSVVVPGGRLRRDERDTLRAAARRLRVPLFRLGDEVFRSTAAP